MEKLNQSDKKMPKHVYLIGSENVGYQGYTYEKKVLKGFLKHRSKHFTSKKVKTAKVHEHLHLSDEIIPFADDIFMFGSEEEFFLESFGPYLNDTMSCLDRLTKQLKVLKLTEEEKKTLSHLELFVKNVKALHKFSEEFDCDDIEAYENGIHMDNVVDWDEAKRYFIKHVLDAESS